MEQEQKLNKSIKTGLFLLVATLAFGLSAVATSCSNADDATAQEGISHYKYINAAEERESVSDEQRQEYAVFAWRNERSPESTMPKNFRTCMSDFKECDAHNGFDPDYIPSRKGLDFMRNPDVAEKDVIYRHYLQGGNFMYYQGDDPDESEWKIELAKEKAEMMKLLYRYVQENHSKGYPVTWTEWKSR